jgi:sarcosine oxidase subunit gamma
MAEAQRIGPLDGRSLAAAGVTFTPLAPEARFSFRCREAGIEAAGAAFGVALPRVVGGTASANGRTAIWLGPDEWLFLAPLAETGAVKESIESGLADQPHSLVEISHRQTAFEVAGPAAATVLAHGSPLDLGNKAFPIGFATRSVFLKTELILWRTGADSYRIEIWRSFADYLWGVLEQAAIELAE